MRSILHILAAVTVLLMSASCERRPLMDLSNTHYVRVYINEDIKNVTTGFYDTSHNRPDYSSPDVLRVVLADPQTGAVKAERFLRDKGSDEKGTYYEGYIIAQPGEYRLLAYNFDTETVVISDANNHSQAKASTNEIASHLRSRIPSRSSQSYKQSAGTKAPESIVYDPDHLFLANCGDLLVPYVEDVDTLKTRDGEHFSANTVVTSYYLQVKVKGMQYVSSSVALLTGMSGSVWLSDGSMDKEHEVTVYFEMVAGGENSASGISSKASSDEVLIYTTFNTFGKLPDAANNLEITFDFLTVYGKPYSATFDITDEFHTPEAIEHHWLLLDQTIEIPEPPEGGDSGGGFTPSVDDWSDVESDIVM